MKRLHRKGIVLGWDDVVGTDWPEWAASAGLNTISLHTVEPLSTTADGRAFLARCAASGVEVEQEQHAMAELLPRSLFESKPDLFRMNEEGDRTPDFDCCASSAEGLELIAENAVRNAEAQRSTTGRFYFWFDDGGQRCHCPLCRQLSATDQALVVENSIARALRALDESYSLSHLAYQSTIEAPRVVVPEPNVFLEFAPFFRSWQHPLSDRAVYGPQWPLEIPDRESVRAERRDDRRMSHGEYLDLLDENLAVFPPDTAQVLEYWLDVSLFSDWKLPAVELPWREEVIASDVATYVSRGIRNITTFAAYMGAAYFERFPGRQALECYGRALRDAEAS